MDAATVTRVLAEELPVFKDSSAKLHVTANHDTEWHQVYFVGDGQNTVVVSIPSWIGTELRSKTLAEEALAGLGPCHIATLRHGDHVLLVNEFFEGGTLKPSELNANVLAKLGALYGQLHKAKVGWFEPVREALLQDGVLSSCESNWAFCLWVLPRLQSH